MRALFDAGLADVLPVSRAALAPPGTANDASLLYGSAPNVYTPTAQALKMLLRAGIVGEEALKRAAPAYGPRNSLFLAHELAVRDVRVTLEGCARIKGHKIEHWQDGEEAAIGLGCGSLSVRPDAWFAYRMGEIVLVGLVELDRGTERGERRWGEKIEAYDTLFADREVLPAITGYVNARVLVLCPNERRRDHITCYISERGQNVATYFWLTTQQDFEDAFLTAPTWCRPGGGMRSLLPNSSV